MHRFFLSPDLIQKKGFVFPTDTAHQISRVLRLHAGKTVRVLDGLGHEYLVELTRVDYGLVEGKIIDSNPVSGEPKTFVRLLVGLTQREKFEWILQKCTEIGVCAYTPLVTSRTLIQKINEVEEKYPRWQKIILEAAEQSHRGIIPILEPTRQINEIMARKLDSGTTGLFLWEDETEIELKSVLQATTNRVINLVVGPEGGFTREEADLARKAGYLSVSVGKRILRLETAAMLAAGLVIYQLE
jgi:16S rRNA (uracil1498-N3)-methyltransferase